MSALKQQTCSTQTVLDEERRHSSVHPWLASCCVQYPWLAVRETAVLCRRVSSADTAPKQL
jgi:hypothetical protein